MASYKEFNNSVNKFSEELTKDLIDGDFKKEMLAIRKYLHNKKNIEQVLDVLVIIFKLDKEKNIDAYLSNFINVYNTTPNEVKENFKEYYEEQLNRKYWEDYVNEQEKKIIKVSNEIKGEKWDKFKEFATIVTQVKKLRNTKEVAVEFGEDLDTYERVINHAVDRYLKDVKQLKYEQLRAIKYSLTKASYKDETVRQAFFNIEEEEQNLKDFVGNDVDDNNNLILATQLKIAVNLKLIKILKYELELEQRKQQNTIKYEPIALPITYNDIASVTDTDSVLNASIKGLVGLGYDQETAQDLAILNTFDFSLDNTKLQEEENKLNNSLNALDKAVLDTIVIDFYLNQNQKEFSDRQIAAYLSEKGGRAKISETTQEDVNNSILKLESTRFSLDSVSLQKFKKNKVKVKQDNPLIWLKHINVDNGTSTHYYQVIAEPFYLTYLMLTDSRIYNYSRELNYRKIDGAKNTSKFTTLRLYINRRLTIAKGSQQQKIYIGLNELYKELDINSTTYPKDTNLRKAKQYVRDQVELIFNDVRKVDAATGKAPFSFNYTKDNNNSRGIIKGYNIEFTQK